MGLTSAQTAPVSSLSSGARPPPTKGGMERILVEHIQFLQAPVPGTWSLTPFLEKRHQSSLERWLIPRLGQGRVKMSMKEMLPNTSTMTGAYQRKTGDNLPHMLERAANGPGWNDVHHKANSNVLVLDRDLQYEITPHVHRDTKKRLNKHVSGGRTDQAPWTRILKTLCRYSAHAGT